MSRPDVYEGEMPKRALTDRQIEILLSGLSPKEESLARFGSVLTTLHGPTPAPPGERHILTLAAEAAALGRKPAEETPSPSQSRRGPRPVFGLKRRLAGGLAAAVLLSGMTGVAVAANGSGPGDALYGLDRALEAVGIGDGGAAERIEEARRLLEKGELATAIGQIADAVEAGSTAESFSPEAVRASEALRGAADSVRGGQEGLEPEDVRSAVAAMLTEIAEMLEADELNGAALGERISEMARALGEGRGQDRAPVQTEDADPTPPGQSGNAGQGRGSSGENRGGPPADTPGGRPDNVPGGPSNRP